MLRIPASSGFSYHGEQASRRTSGFATDGAAIYSLQVCGLYDDPDGRRGQCASFPCGPASAMVDLRRELRRTGAVYDRRRYVAALVCAATGAIGRERAEGGDLCHWEGDVGTVYCTAAYATILAMPHYLAVVSAAGGTHCRMAISPTSTHPARRDPKLTPGRFRIGCFGRSFSPAGVPVPAPGSVELFTGEKYSGPVVLDTAITVTPLNGPGAEVRLLANPARGACKDEGCRWTAYDPAGGGAAKWGASGGAGRGARATAVVLDRAARVEKCREPEIAWVVMLSPFRGRMR